MSGSQFHFPQRTDSFTLTSGSTTFVVPRNVNFIQAVIAGGGGGGERGAPSGDGSGAGGAGGQISVVTLPVTPGETLSLNVGIGGAGGIHPGSNSTSGGLSSLSGSFGTVVAPGGVAGGIGGGGGVLYLRGNDNFIHGGGRGGTGRQPGGPIVATSGEYSIYASGGTHTTYGGGGGGGLGVGGNGGGGGPGSPGTAGGISAGGGGGGPAANGGNGGRGEIRLYWFSKF